MDNSLEWRRVREQVGILAGERGDRKNHAIRRGAISAVVVPQMTASKISAAPTASDYNKLVEDLTALRAVLAEIVGAAK